MQPLTIVISFDVDKQVLPGCIPGWITSLMYEFSFQVPKQLSIGALMLLYPSSGFRERSQ
jgi:hypothetical protein